MATNRATFHAPWSASKVQTALRCPRLFHYRYVDKVPEPEVMPETRIGKAVHAAIEQALSGILVPHAIEEGAKILASRVERERYDALCAGIPAFLERVEAFRRRRRVARQLVEYTLAVTSDFNPTSFYSSDAFFRGIVDTAYLYDSDSLAVIDHKTGQRHPHADIAEQLEGYAVLACSSFPRTKKIWLGIHWMAAGVVDWSSPLSAQEARETVVPRVKNNIEAAALAVDDGPRPAPSSWCLRCSYRSICDVGREMRFEPVDDEEPPWM